MKGTAVPDDAQRRSHAYAHEGLADDCSSAAAVRVAINNYYADGHSSLTIVDLEPPGEEIDEWFQEVVFPHTGDGHGAQHPKLGILYEAEIVDAVDSTLIRRRCEWDG